MSRISVVIIIRIKVIYIGKIYGFAGGRAPSVFPYPSFLNHRLSIAYYIMYVSVRPYHMCSILDGMSRPQRFSVEPTARPLVNVTCWAEEQPRRTCDLTEHSRVPESPTSKVAMPEERRRPRANRFVQFIYVVFLLFYVDRQL